MSMGTSALLSGTSSRTQEGNYINDGHVAGQIGKRNLLKTGCFSFFEAWTLAARQIVLDGRYAEAKATLDAGATVRSLLQDWYGVFSESVSSDTAFYETKAFRRTMRNALRSTNS
jgi:hypothetical protein